MEDVKEIKKENFLTKNVNTILLGCITFGLTQGISKLNTMNESLIRMEEQNKAGNVIMAKLQTDINDLKLTDRDHEGRLKTLELTKSK